MSRFLLDIFYRRKIVLQQPPDMGREEERANRNRDAFEQTFKRLVEQIEKELRPKFRGGCGTASRMAPQNNHRPKVSAER